MGCRPILKLGFEGVVVGFEFEFGELEFLGWRIGFFLRVELDAPFLFSPVAVAYLVMRNPLGLI